MNWSICTQSFFMSPCTWFRPKSIFMVHVNGWSGWSGWNGRRFGAVENKRNWQGWAIQF